MKERQTAGKLALTAKSDETIYDPLEVGHAANDDVLSQIWKCIDRHIPIINENEFCVIIQLAEDCLIKGVMRRKFYAWPYLPKPRPNQTVFLYRKDKDDILLLWCLPTPQDMAILSSTIVVPEQFKRMQRWSVYFYSDDFHGRIRNEHGITLLSEKEYLNAHRQELIKAGCQDFGSLASESVDVMDVALKNVVNTGKSLSKKNGLDDFRQT